MTDRRIRMPEVVALTGMSRATVWRRIKAGELHSPEKDGNITYWRESWIKAYIDKNSDQEKVA
jgi:predicted DNA-binding transcriptional regulator AlpA